MYGLKTPLSLVVGVIVCLSAMTFSQRAEAVACNPQGTGGFADTSYLTVSTSCAVGPDVNDDASDVSTLLGMPVLFAEKYAESDQVGGDLLTEDHEVVINIGFQLTNTGAGLGNPFSGGWEVASDFWDNFTKLVLVQKDGNADPGSWVAFVIQSGVTSGSYFSIFDDGKKNISHISAYVVTAVPLPAALPLFGGALGLLGFLGLRRRRKAASFA